MRSLYAVAAVRAAEQELLVATPEGALMARAAAGLARRCAALPGTVYGSRVLLLVGSGNNGGDALYAGALLAGRGCAVTAVLAGQTPHPGGLAALRAAGGRVEPWADNAWPATDLVVDGLVGTGGSGSLREPYAMIAGRLASVDAPVVAVDVPSGVDASTGEVAGAAVRADVTVAFGALKPGLLVSPGAGYTGLVELVDIGLGALLPEAGITALDAADVATMLPTPHGESSKYTRGVVGVVTGSQQYTGAAVLSTGGAVRAGAGMVRFVGVPHAADQVRARWPEVVVTDLMAGPWGGIAEPARILDAGRVQAWVCGSGLGKGSTRVVEAVLDADVPVLVDADGVTSLTEHHGWLARAAGTLITPHAGEFATLMGAERGDVEAHRLSWVRRAADQLGATVLLKGATTVIAEPGGRTAVNTVASPYLGTAGSGDVLSGVCGSLMAQGLSPFDAARVGAFLHGLAGRFASEGVRTEGLVAGPIGAADLLDVWADVERSVRSTRR